MLYDGFGMAFMWMVNSIITRGILALLALVLLVVTGRIWYFHFLKTAFTQAFFNSPEAQRSYFIAVFLRPWILGVLVLMAFNWPFTNLYWPAFLVSLGYLAIIMVGDPVIQFQPSIKTSDKQIFTSRIQRLSVIAALILIWAVGNIRVKF